MIERVSHMLHPIWLAAMSKKPATAIEETDYTRSLAHFEGADESQSPTDEVAGVTITIGETSVLDTAQKKWGSSSARFSSSEGVSIEGIAADDTTEWTVEFWCYSATKPDLYMYIQEADFDSICEVEFRNSVFTAVLSQTDGSTAANPSGGYALSDATWIHVAIVRSATDLTLYSAGERRATASITGTARSGIARVYLIDNGGVVSWIDDLRTSKVVRYSGASYTVPPAAFEVD
jgi:hypothetical protein